MYLKTTGKNSNWVKTVNAIYNDRLERRQRTLKCLFNADTLLTDVDSDVEKEAKTHIKYAIKCLKDSL